MTHYETLGVPRSSTIDEIRSAYVRKAKEVHPDAGGVPEDFHNVHQAYQVLGNGVERKKYDAWLDESYMPCLKCSGRGIVITTKSFKERSVRPCIECKGSGVGAKR